MRYDKWIGLCLKHRAGGIWSIAFFYFAGLLLPSGLYAGAWPQDSHHGQIILTYSFMQTSKAYDEGGAIQKFGDDGEFRQIVLNPYLEYGLSERNTLSINAQTSFLRYQNNYGSQSSSGFGDVEFAVRHRFNAPESPWVLSGQFTVMFPAYSAHRNPAPGNHQEDLETRLMVGHGSTWAKHHIFWDAQAAYRSRFGAPADQIRSDWTAGIDLHKNVMAMAQIFNTWSMHNGTPMDEITNPNAQSDYNVHKAQISMVFTTPHRTRIQAGWTGVLKGRNVGGGQTFILAFWKSF